MKPSFSILLSLFLFCGIWSLKAQDTTKTTTTIIYSKVGVKSSKDNQADYEASKKNLIKVDPLAILVGEIPFLYERQLSKKFSVEVLVGITHSDYLYELTNLGFIDNTGDRSPLFGYTFGAAFKFYPSEYTFALEGPYFGLEARYKRFNTNLINNCSSSSSNDYFLEKRNVIDGKIIGGYIWHPGDNFIIEAYGGLGIRSLNIDGFVCQSSGPTSIFAQRDITSQRLALSLGIRLGFAF